MKLKNSYILLIVMSIFLLISIGSVCANDVSDAQLADDGSDVIAVDNDNSIVSDDDTNTSTEKIDTSVVSEDVRINEGETANITVSVKDNESNDITIVKENLTVSENENNINFDYNNSVITILDNLASGNHSLVIKYLGNDNYNASSTNMTLSVAGNYTMNVPTSVNMNSTKIVVIPIEITNGVDVYEINKNNITLVLSYTEDNETKNKTIDSFELINGAIQFNYDANVTPGTVTVDYNDEAYSFTQNTTINQIINGEIRIINSQAEYRCGNFTFLLVDIDNNNTPVANRNLKYTILTGSINTAGTITTDENGIATLDNRYLNIYKMDGGSITSEAIPVGNQSFTIESDDSSVICTKVESNFTITKVAVNITLEEYKEYYGSEKQVVINVTNAVTGEAMYGIIVHLYMENTTQKDFYLMTGVNGTCGISVYNATTQSGLVGGTYKMVISNNDTVNIENTTISGSITIIPVPVKYTVSGTTNYYNTGSSATIKITNKNTGKVVPYAYVLVTIDNNQYLFQANSKGVVTISASLAVGKHKMVVSSADTRYTGSSVTSTLTVKKASAKITASKVTAYYKQGKYFTIKLTNTKNNKAIYDAKLNIRIYVSSTSYYNYNGNTGLNGQLKLLIDLKPGTYKVVVKGADSKDFTVKQVTSKIVVKKAPTKLYPTKLTAKKGASKYFKVTVKNTKTKKIIKGVKVKIKVYTGKKYKTYTVKTNSKGIAQINVKSLKVGTHKVVVTSANKYCVAKTATSSIKITKK
ncbi:MAG: hypothetical protein IJ122_01830 [Methanobrevibacter sp.]|nr:hypothetical protein [Methanobrevibacter sp.]